MFLPIRFLTNDGWKYVGYQGLASHGGTFGLIVALWFYVRKTKLSIWRVLDNIAIATGTTACFIRLGNLMNSEIIGKITDVPWAFVFEKVDAVPRHPGQLYRALLHHVDTTQTDAREDGYRLVFRLLSDVYLHLPFLHRVHQGDTRSLRGIVPIDMGQILSIPFIILGVYCMLRARK